MLGARDRSLHACQLSVIQHAAYTHMIDIGMALGLVLLAKFLLPRHLPRHLPRRGTTLTPPYLFASPPQGYQPGRLRRVHVPVGRYPHAVGSQLPLHSACEGRQVRDGLEGESAPRLGTPKARRQACDSHEVCSTCGYCLVINAYCTVKRKDAVVRGRVGARAMPGARCSYGYGYCW